MLAKHQGLIQGRVIRTKALKIEKSEDSSSVDSETTDEYLEKPKPTKRRTSKTQEKPEN